MWRWSEAGYSLLLVLVLVAALSLTGLAALTLGRHDVRVAQAAAGDEAALMLAEVGAWRALDLLEIVPSWRTAPGAPLRGTLPVGAQTGSYEVTVEDTGQEADGAPVVRVRARGALGDRVRSVEALAHVEPPAFLRAAVSLFAEYDAKGELETVGDVYVSGSFSHRKKRCSVDGDLIAETFPDTGRGQRPCSVSGQVVSIQQQPSAYRDRPIPPLAWYRWAERRLWLDVYGRSQVPSAQSFQEMLDAARRPEHPFGVMYVVTGDFVLGEEGRKGRSKQDECRGQREWEVQGKLTVVVEGTLTICAKRIKFRSGDTTSRLVLISLEGIEFEPSGGGNRGEPLVGLYYAYDPDALDQGSIRFPTPRRARYYVAGTLAAARLDNDIEFIHVEEQPDHLLRGAAPAVPGMRAVVSSWTVDPEGSSTRERWGLD